MNMFFSKTPDELLARYLHAVRFWLPRGQEEDLLAELSEDLRSQFEAREAELGKPLDEAEAAAILKHTGSPMVVASRYQGQRYLIGPAVFPVYAFVLKLVLLWILVPVFLFIVGPVNVINTHGDWGLAALRTVGGLWSGLFVAAGVITIVFAVLERSQVQLELADKWDPRSLPAVTDPSPAVSFRKTVCEMALAILGLVWLLLVPHHPYAILGPASSFLKLTPVWNPYYIPVVVLAAINIVRLWIGLLRPQWTWFLPLTQVFNTGAFTVVLYFFLSAALHATFSPSSPFVQLVNPESASQQLARVATLVNASILLALLGTWLGMAIAAPIQTWQFLRNARKGTFPSPRPFSASQKVLL